MKQNSQLETDILNFLYDLFSVNGSQVRGQSLSGLKQFLRDEGWKGLGNTHDFETLCEELGFMVVAGTNSRGQKCRVVTL